MKLIFELRLSTVEFLTITSREGETLCTSSCLQDQGKKVISFKGGLSTPRFWSPLVQHSSGLFFPTADSQCDYLLMHEIQAHFQGV